METVEIAADVEEMKLYAQINKGVRNEGSERKAGEFT